MDTAHIVVFSVFTLYSTLYIYINDFLHKFVAGVSGCYQGISTPATPEPRAKKFLTRLLDITTMHCKHTFFSLKKHDRFLIVLQVLYRGLVRL